MSDHQYKFNVTMTCGGCSGAVERVLKKLEGKHRVTGFIAF
jgi:copper chaperone